MLTVKMIHCAAKQAYVGRRRTALFGGDAVFARHRARLRIIDDGGSAFRVELAEQPADVLLTRNDARIFKTSCANI